jgi:hypothetical protein
MAKGKNKYTSSRGCLVCRKSYESNFKLKEHYDNTECGKVRFHERFKDFSSSRAIGKAIQEWKKTGVVPKNKNPHRRKSGALGTHVEVMDALPTEPQRPKNKPRRIEVYRSKPKGHQINFCPCCGFEIGSIQ